MLHNSGHFCATDWNWHTNVGDNGVHASASPFEAMAERMNWLGSSLSEDSFGRSLLASGVGEGFITDGTVDPQVALADGSKGSLFDALEDMDSSACVAKVGELAALVAPVALD